MKSLFFALIAIFISSFSFGQVVTIGTGTEDDDNLPIGPYYGYSYSQCLYLASEIGQTGNIYRVTYKAKPGITISSSNDWDVYVGHTALTEFTVNSWVDTSNLTQVFSGTISVVNDKVEITFSTPFNYDGTSNLVIAVHEKQSGYDGTSDDFYSTNVTGTRSVRYNNDNINADLSNPPANNIGQSAVANIDLDFNATPCNEPTNFTSNNITTTSVDIGWTAGGSETLWNIEYGTAGFTLGNGTAISGASANSQAITGLSSSTTYDFYIQSDCGGGSTSAWAGPFSVSTLCGSVSSINENFDGVATYTLPNCWSAIIDNGASNSSIISTYAFSTPNSGANHLRLYNAGSPDTSNLILVSPPMSNLGDGTHRLRFYAKNSGSTAQDLEVGTVTNSTDGTTFTSLQSVDINGTYTEYTVNFDGYSGSNQFIAIRRLSTSTFTSVFVDDIIWEPIPSCVVPSMLNTSNVVATTVDLGWTENGSATSWQIEYGASGFTLGSGTASIVNTNPTSVSPLTSNTSYDFYVRAICGAGDTSTWVGPFQFTTLCDAVTTLPFVESFETITSGQPNCWGIAGTTTNNNYHWNSYATGETGRGIRFNSYNNPNGRTSELTTPLLDLTSLTQAQLLFYFKNPTGGDFEVLISNDGGANFTSLEAGLNGQTNWLEKTYDITANISNQVVIQFKGTSNYGSGDAYVYLDSVVVRETPSCLASSDLTVTNLTATSADLGWTENGSASSWQIEYGATGFSLGSGTNSNVSANPTNIASLSSNTTYDFYVRAICGAGDTSTWSAVRTFTTPCTSITDFSENFDATPTSEVPSCWNRIIDNGASSSAKVEVSTFSTANSGSNHIRMYNAASPASSNLILVSPPLSNVNAGTHWLRFYARNSYATQDLEIGTISDPSDASTFTVLQTVDIDDTYTEYNVAFASYSGSDQYIAIKRNSTVNYTNVYLDDIIWELAPSCLAPSNLVANNINSTSADLSWTPGGSGGSSWQIEYGVSGFTQGTGVVEIISNNPHTISTLTANTTYDWYIREICGAGDTSTWTSASNFTTACAAVTEFNENFDGVTTPNLPNCWGSIIDNGAVSYVQVQTNSTSAPNSGANHLRMYNSNSADTSNIILVSPQVSNLSAGTHQLRFFAKNVASETQDIEIGTVTNPTDGSTFTSLQSVDINGIYSEYIVSFGAYSGSDQYIAIRRLSTQNYSYVYLDDIVWEVIPTCPQPVSSSLSASNITTTSADLGWTESGSASSWQIEYGVTGFTLGSGTNSTVSANPTNVSSLSANTTYDFYVRSICGAGDTSSWVGPFEFTTLCDVVTTLPFVESFETITTGQPDCWGISGTTTNNSYHWNSFETGETGRGIRFDSYVNSSGNTSELTTPTLDLTSLTQAQLSFFYKNPTGGDFEVLISTDGGANFTSLESGLTGQNNWLEKTYDISSSISNQVIIQFKGTSNYGNGDAYVYLDSVVVGAPPVVMVCNDVSNLTVTNITENSADLSWTENGTATSWQIEYGEENFTQGTGTFAVTSDNPYGLNGLNASEDYEFYVRAICGAGDTSGWVGPFGFATNDPAVECELPTNLTATNITDNSADLGWTENGSATSWQIEYGEEDFDQGEGNLVVTSDNPYTVTGLEEDEDYEFYVRAICANGDTTDWVGPFEFETEETSSIDENSISIVKVYPNPASSVIYIKSDDNSEYTVELFDMKGQKVFFGNMVKSINVESLQNGLYHIRITNSIGVQNERILVE